MMVIESKICFFNRKIIVKGIIIEGIMLFIKRDKLIKDQKMIKLQGD